MQPHGHDSAVGRSKEQADGRLPSHVSWPVRCSRLSAEAPYHLGHPHGAERREDGEALGAPPSQILRTPTAPPITTCVPWKPKGRQTLPSS